MVNVVNLLSTIIVSTLLSCVQSVILTGGTAAPAVATVAYTAGGATMTATATTTAGVATAAITAGTTTATATATAATTGAIFAETAGTVIAAASGPIGWIVIGTALVAGTAAAPIDTPQELNNQDYFVPDFSDWVDSNEWRIH